MVKTSCFFCKKTIYKYPSQIKRHKHQFCDINCRSEWNKTLSGYWLGKTMSKEARQNMSANHADFSGSKNGRWKGGKRIDKDGYVLVLKKDHPFADYHGYVREHRLEMEKYLGRYLKPEENVHHVDKNKQNNKIDNLKLYASTSEHQKYHYHSGDAEYIKYSPGWKKRNSEKA